MNIIKQLNWRYAVKNFNTDKKISLEDIETIAESLRLSASSFGLQPWKFYIIENQEVKNKLMEHSFNQVQIKEASHLVVFCRPRTIDDQFVDRFLESTAQVRNVEMASLEGYGNMMKGFLSRKDDKQKTEWAKNQVYIALGNLLTTCAMMNIDSCPMEGILPSKYDEVLGLTESDYTTVVACPLGYRSHDDKYASLAKVRFPQEKVIEFIR